MCEIDEPALDPAEEARLAGLMLFGLIVADLIAHPHGAGKVLEALHG